VLLEHARQHEVDRAAVTLHHLCPCGISQSRGGALQKQFDELPVGIVGHVGVDSASSG
jgi:hypothetical protein